MSCLKKVTSVLIFSLLFCKVSIAQSNDSSSIIIFQDPRLAAMDDRPAAVVKFLAGNKPEKPVEMPLEKTDEISENKSVVTEIKVGNKTVSGTINTADGYRVLLYSGTSKAVAMSAKSTFDKAYPKHRSYLGYNAPRYKIKAGDFENRKDAEKLLNQVIKFAPSASVVPDVVTVKNITVQ